MIRILIAKDMRLVTWDRVFSIVLVGYLFGFLAGSLAFFSSFINSGIAQVPAASELLFFRIGTLLWVLVSGISPWLILRMNTGELEHVSMSAAKPWQVLLSKAIASSTYVAVMLILSFPVFTLVTLVGAVGLRQIAWFIADTFFFVTILNLLILHLRIRFAGLAVSWTLAYAALIVLGIGWYEIRSALDQVSASLILLLLLVFLGVLLVIHGNRALIYERN